jgi:hypothetical protein
VPTFGFTAATLVGPSVVKTYQRTNGREESIARERAETAIAWRHNGDIKEERLGGDPLRL